MIRVLAPGPLATVQDLGRTGFSALGVGRSGAADAAAHRLANRLVGNATDSATIEITLGGLDIVLADAATLALAGACCPLSGHPGVSFGVALSLPAGARLSLGVPVEGLRSYLAVRGGIAVPAVLGSRSTDTLSGLGPPALAPGDLLPVGAGPAGDPSAVAVAPWRPVPGPVGVIPGPRADWFDDQAWDLLTGRRWTVQPTSNRIGLRLAGPALRRSVLGVAELPSEPTLPGAIQVPPQGSPIVLGPDAPVTGGYPVIAVVPSTELDRLAQLRPGDSLRFAAPRVT